MAPNGAKEADMSCNHLNSNHLDFDARAREARAVAMRELWGVLRERIGRRGSNTVN